MKPVRRTIDVGGRTLDLVLARKRVKNVNVRLVGDELRVSAPPSLPDDRLTEIVVSLAQRLLRRRHADRVNREVDALELAQRVARRFPDSPEVAAVRFTTNQRARWGSYSVRIRTIHLNAALRRMPRWVLEAVVAHELAHVRHPNHSPAFWNLLRGVCPETDRAKAFLEGVGWLGRSWHELPPEERDQLSGSAVSED